MGELGLTRVTVSWHQLAWLKEIGIPQDVLLAIRRLLWDIGTTKADPHDPKWIVSVGNDAR